MKNYNIDSLSDIKSNVIHIKFFNQFNNLVNNLLPR